MRRSKPRSVFASAGHRNQGAAGKPESRPEPEGLKIEITFERQSKRQSRPGRGNQQSRRGPSAPSLFVLTKLRANDYQLTLLDVSRPASPGQWWFASMSLRAPFLQPLDLLSRFCS